MGIFGDVIEELVERTDSGIMKWSPFDPQAGWRVASLRYACQVFPTYRRFDVTVREVRGEATTVTIRDAEEIIPLIEALLRKHPRKMDRGVPYGLQPAELDEKTESVLRRFQAYALGG